MSGDLQLAEPHFEDEATLLSARPVVPLQALEARARSARTLVFGLAMVVALMLGALGATLIYKQRVQKEDPAQMATTTATAIAEPTSLENPPASEAPVTTPESGEAKSSTAKDEIDAAAGGARNSEASKQRASLASQNAETGRRAIEPSETLNKRDRKEIRRAERVDAGLRRSAKIEARREARQRQTPNGLFRVREIFEGGRIP